MKDIKAEIRRYILEEIMHSRRPEDLTDDMPLVRSGILDSIATLELITFLETELKIEFLPHELTRDHLETVTRIHAAVTKKLEPADVH